MWWKKHSLIWKLYIFVVLFITIYFIQFLQLVDATILNSISSHLNYNNNNNNNKVPKSSGFRIALHCQAKFAEHGWVAGSEITTAGLKKAFESFPVVDHVEVFAPFSYHNLLTNGPWDFVLIEGYSGSVPEFIKTIRDTYEQSYLNNNNNSPHVNKSPPIVAHFCLDTYPSVDLIVQLDVDMFFTNSHSMKKTLNQYAPTYFFELAADPDLMKPSLIKHPIYSKHNVVYLGHNSATKEHLHNMLREAIPYGLTIYGHNWGSDKNTDLVKQWRGILPKDDIGLLYSNAKVVIGVTEDKQRSEGMINNRVFEVLSTGAPLISDHFDYLEDKFGKDVIMFYKQKGDMKIWLDRILHNETLRMELKQKGRQHILDKETWVHRATGMFKKFKSLHEKRILKALNDHSFANSIIFWRHNRPRVCVLYLDNNKNVIIDTNTNNDKDEEVLLENLIIPELLHLEEFYRIDLLSYKYDNNKQLLKQLDLYDIILIHDHLNGKIDTTLRNLHMPYKVISGENGFRDHTGIHGRKILLIKDGNNDDTLQKMIQLKKSIIEFYDGIILPSSKHILKVIDDTVSNYNDNIDGNKHVAFLEKYYYDTNRIFRLPIETFKRNLADGFPCKIDNDDNKEDKEEIFFNVLFNQVYLRSRHSARIYFQTPMNGEIIYITSKMTQVDILSGVVLENFIPPRDGMWCLRIDKEEVLCNGDEKFNIKTTVDVPLDVKEKHMVLEVVLRNHFQRLVVFDGSTSNYGNQQNIGKNLKTNIIRITIKRTTDSHINEINAIKDMKKKIKPTLIQRKFNEHVNAVIYKVNKLPSDFSRVYCKFIIPLMSSNKNGLVIGTIEGRDMEPLMETMMESKCNNSCHVTINPGIPFQDNNNNNNGNWYCYLPTMHYNISMIIESSIVLKTIKPEALLNFNQLYGIIGKSVLIKRKNDVYNNDKDQTLYISNDCKIHQRNMIKRGTMKNDDDDDSFIQLYRSECFNYSSAFSSSFSSSSLLPPYVVIWNYNFNHLNSLKKNSFISITIKISLDDVDNGNSNEFKILFAECKKLLQNNNGTLRVVLMSSNKSRNLMYNKQQDVMKTMQMNGFNLIQSVNPMTTTAMVPNFEEIEYLIHGNEIDLEKDLFIVEGYLDDDDGGIGRSSRVARAFKIL